MKSIIVMRLPEELLDTPADESACREAGSHARQGRLPP